MSLRATTENGICRLLPTTIFISGLPFSMALIRLSPEFSITSTPEASNAASASGPVATPTSSGSRPCFWKIFCPTPT